MMKRFKILIILLVLVMMFFPIGTLAFGSYRESYKNTWNNNYTDYTKTVTGNACQVSDGVVVLSLSHDIKLIEKFIDISAKKYDSDKTRTLALLNFFDDNIEPVITITKYDDNGKILWEDKFTDGFSFYYGMVSDSEDNVYVIGLKGLRKYNKNGKLVDTNKNVTGYTIYKFGDYYAVFNAKLLKLYDEYKLSVITGDNKKRKIVDSETELSDIKLKLLEDETLFEVKFYDKNFKLVKTIDESLISVNTQACIENNKMYYLTFDEDAIINEVDSNLNVLKHKLTTSEEMNYNIVDNASMLSTIVKNDTGFYITNLDNILKVDSNYNVNVFYNKGYDDGFITGMIKKNNNYFVSYLDTKDRYKKGIDDSEHRENYVDVYGKVKVYDSNFNYLDEFDVNKAFDFKSSGLNNTITAITRIVDLNDGFMVLGVNITSGYDFINSANDYYEYLYDKYREGDLRSMPSSTKVPTITYPKTKAFLLRYGDGYQIKTNVVSGSGRVSLSKSFSTGNEKILYTVVPDDGYAVSSLRVYTVSGKEINVINNNSFEMPDEDVIIDVAFKKVTNPNTFNFAFIWIVCLGIVGVASYMVFKSEKKLN